MRSIQRFFLLFLCFGFFFSLFAVAVIFLCDQHIVKSGSGRIHSNLSTVAPHRVALVPGCSPTVANGRANLYFTHRINAAAEAYHAGKCRYIIVSGDNSRKDYNEPQQMKSALIEKGVPAKRVFEDYAGFRTLDSVVRAEKVFGQKRLLVISQQFHNERAVFIGEHKGMKMTAYNAKDVGSFGGIRTRIREKLARVKTVIDLHVIHASPKYLGNAIHVGDSDQ